MKDCHRERHGIARRFCIGLDCLSVPDDHRTHYPLPRLAIRPSAYICDSLLNLCERVQRTCIKWDMNASFSCKICLEALFSKKEFQRLFFFFLVGWFFNFLCVECRTYSWRLGFIVCIKPMMIKIQAEVVRLFCLTRSGFPKLWHVAKRIITKAK